MDFYREILENIPDGILVFDEASRITFTNKAVEEISGFTAEEIKNKNFSEILMVRSNCSCDENGLNEKFTAIADIKQKSGKVFPVRVSYKPDGDKKIAVITSLSDIACLNQAHLDFVSTVSHELRTPLTSIKGFADTMISAGDKLDAEQRTRFVSIIKSQVDRLARLVENLLTVSRLESKKDKAIYKAVNFEKFIDTILHSLAPKAQNHKVELNIYPNLPPVWVDEDKFEQIMINLVDNALKYSNQNTTVTVSAAYCVDDSEFVEIRVKDQGFGIPEEFLSKIFTKFSRIDNPLTRGVQGTGLGLYITKSLVDGMGGKIWAESDGNGSTFILKFPVATHEKHASEKFLSKN